MLSRHFLFTFIDSFSFSPILPSGNCEFTIGSHFSGKISALNIWDRVLDSLDVYWMSFGCGEVIDEPLISWKVFQRGFMGNVTILRPASCKEFKGKFICCHLLCNDISIYQKCYISFLLLFIRIGRQFLAIKASQDSPNHTAIYKSPWEERSTRFHGTCMRFRYLLYGRGKTKLQILQHLNFSRGRQRVVWEDSVSNQTDREWKYGLVSLATVGKYRV